MRLEHVALWTRDLEKIKAFYVTYLGATANDKYINPTTCFESYFLSFSSGARLEIMCKPAIPQNLNDTIEAQHLGLIHLAFEVKTMEEVDKKAAEFKAAGIPVLRGPRKTGDGYYEFETLDPDNNRIEITTIWQASSQS